MRARPDGDFEPVEIDLAEADRAPIESREPGRLDPERAAAQPEGPPVPASRQRASPIGWIGSLAIHLLPLLVLLDWSLAPAEITQPPPIPVHLVIAAPPPP